MKTILGFKDDQEMNEKIKKFYSHVNGGFEHRLYYYAEQKKLCLNANFDFNEMDYWNTQLEQSYLEDNNITREEWGKEEYKTDWYLFDQISEAWRVIFMTDLIRDSQEWFCEAFNLARIDKDNYTRDNEEGTICEFEVVFTN